MLVTLQLISLLTIVVVAGDGVSRRGSTTVHDGALARMWLLDAIDAGARGSAERGRVGVCLEDGGFLQVEEIVWRESVLSVMVKHDFNSLVKHDQRGGGNNNY